MRRTNEWREEKKREKKRWKKGNLPSCACNKSLFPFHPIATLGRMPRGESCVCSFSVESWSKNGRKDCCFDFILDFVSAHRNANCVFFIASFFVFLFLFVSRSLWLCKVSNEWVLISIARYLTVCFPFFFFSFSF